MEELNNIKKEVGAILKDSHSARNCDKFLILEVWKNHGFTGSLNYYLFKKLPSTETIRRSRQYWQGTRKMYLSDDMIFDQRKKHEEKIKNTFRNYS